MNKGKIIFLNGVSSAGKSTLADALIKRLNNYFVLSVDHFDEWIIKIEDRENNRLIPIETEYLFHRNIALISSRGINVIVDHVIHDEFTQHDILEVLKDYPVLFVGVHCPVDELTKREINRGNRTIGQAQAQLAFVHHKEVYDVEVNTFNDDINHNVDKIVNALEHLTFPGGFYQTAIK